MYFCLTVFLSVCPWLYALSNQDKPGGTLDGREDRAHEQIESHDVLLSRIARTLRQLGSITFVAEYSHTHEGRGSPTSQFGVRQVHATMVNDGRFRVERKKGIIRPDGFADIFGENYTDGQGAALVVFDGKHVTEWIESENVWTRYPIDEAVEEPVFRKLLVNDTAMTLHTTGSWLAGNGRAALTPWNYVVKEGTAQNAAITISQERVDEQRCFSLKARASHRELPMIMTVTHHVFFDKNTYLPIQHNVSAAYKLILFPIGKQIMTTRYLNMETNVPVVDDLFSFNPPEGSVFIPPDDERFRKSLSAGEPAPPLALPSVGSETVEIADYRGKKAVLLSFWSTTCAPCLREMPMLCRLHDEFNDKGLAVVGVSLGDELSTLKTFLENRPLPYTVVHDAALASKKNYYVGSIPHTLLIDKEGIVVRVWLNWEGEKEEKEIRAELAKLGIGE